MKKSILVHNIGHHDLLLLIKDSENAVESMLPKSFGFDSICTWLNEFEISNLFSSGKIDNDELYFAKNSQLLIPDNILKKIELLKKFKDSKDSLTLVGLKFPIIYPVVHEWINDSADWENELLIMSSAPEERSLSGSATNGVAELSKLFIEYAHPRTTVTLLEPFKYDPFRHDDLTVHLDKLKEYVNNLRTALVEATNEYSNDPEEWQNLFRVFLSVNTGTVPLITGIHASLRNYEPVHIYVSKARQRAKASFLLGASKIDFNTYEHKQSKKVKDASPEIRSITKEMLKWKDDFCRKERDPFWHRKGKKAVLAVLAYRDDNNRTQYTRSCNLEVSLPTGSLCAERNAIGSVLAKMPYIHRNDFLMIAVLSLIDHKGSHLNPIAPCGVCNEWLLKFAEVNPDFKVLSYNDPSCNLVYIKQLM